VLVAAQRSRLERSRGRCILVRLAKNPNGDFGSTLPPAGRDRGLLTKNVGRASEITKGLGAAVSEIAGGCDCVLCGDGSYGTH
jgi:hypothetical protein